MNWCSHCGLTPCVRMRSGKTKRRKPLDPCKKTSGWCSGCGMNPCAKAPK